MPLLADRAEDQGHPLIVAQMRDVVKAEAPDDAT